MELDSGLMAFSIPSRPCKLDRSCSWTGYSKSTFSDSTRNIPSQYSVTDFDIEYGHHYQSTDLFDIPSIFDDALAQYVLASNFVCQPDITEDPTFWANETLYPQLDLQQETGPEFGLTPSKSDNEQETSGTTNMLSSFICHDSLMLTSEPVPELSQWQPVSLASHNEHDVKVSSPCATATGVAWPYGFLETITEESVTIAEYMSTQTNTEVMMCLPTSSDLQNNIAFNMVESPNTSTNDDNHYDPKEYYQPTFQSTEPAIAKGSSIATETPAYGFSDILDRVLPDISVNRSMHVTSLPPLDHLLSRFDADPLSGVPKRRRKAFTEHGKVKVKNVRESGACVFCRARKVSCIPKGACPSCVKLSCRTPLVDHICVRTRLGDTFVGVRALHGSSFDNRKARLQPLLSSLIGFPTSVQLSVEAYSDHDSVPFRNNDHHIRTLASLDIQVMQSSSSSLCRWKKLTKVSGIYITSDIFDAQRYVIVPSSLPSIDQFDRFGRQILLASDGGHSGHLVLLLDRFLAVYCAGNSSSDLARVVNLTSRIASLNNLVAYGFLNFRDGSYDLLRNQFLGHHDERYVSETVHDQIRLLAAEGLEPAETIVFHELDNMSKYVSANDHGRMIIGICLLRLMLLYRNRLVRDEIRLTLPKQKKWHQYRLEKASFMYRRLAVTYGALCREYDTPLTMAIDESDATLFREDQMLKDSYLPLQPAFLEFCQEKLSLEYDDVLRVLLADPTKQQKTKKRRKTSR